jgi:ornithine carbamoyltransferase
VFDAGLAISIFRDNSTRTRFSFAAAANALGLTPADLDEGKSQIAHGETVRETANMISFMAEVIGIRDDMYLGEGNRYMREVAAAVQEGFEQGVLHQRPSVINLQCDIDHPTQSMADLAHLKNIFGSLENLRGKKIAMSWAYSPSGGKFEVVSSMEEAFRDADVVYPKSWAPFDVMQRRTPLLRKGDRDGLKALEQECLANNAGYKNWECDEKIMKLTKGGDALYMHCLPADISGVSCAQGEVSKGVFEKYRIATHREAGYKPFVIAAMMFLARVPSPLAALRKLSK